MVEKNGKLNLYYAAAATFGRPNESSPVVVIKAIKRLIHLLWLHFKNMKKKNTVRNRW